jgi:hypothetical protein
MSRGRRYVTSTMRWLAAGSPIRSDDQVDEIFATHCVPCPWLVDNVCTHKGCQCNVVSSRAESRTILGRILGGGMVNKLRRRTEKCPDGRWK